MTPAEIAAKLTPQRVAIRALPPADTSALGAVAMQQAAIAEIDCGGCYGRCNDPANCQMEDVKAIRAIPLPTHTAQLAAALALPEVAALWAALDDMCVIAKSADWDISLSGRQLVYRNARNALSALEARHD